MTNVFSGDIVGPFVASHATIRCLADLWQHGNIFDCVLGGWSSGPYTVRLRLPPGCTPIPGQADGVARLRLPSGDVLVARQRDVDPAGPWALSVELAEHANHRERLAALHASFAAGEVALEDLRRATENERWVAGLLGRGSIWPCPSEDDDAVCKEEL